MHRRIQREDDAEEDQSCNDGGGRADAGGECRGDGGGQQGEQERKTHRRAAVGTGISRRGFTADQGGGGRLHRAVADDPQRHERSRLPERPAEHGGKEDRQPDHEPDITCAEEKQPRHREHVHGPVAREQVAEFRLLVSRAEVAAHHQCGADQGQHDQTENHPHRCLESDQREQQAAEEKPDPLECVLAAGQQRDPAIETPLVFARDQFDGALAAHFREILGDARERLGCHHVADGEKSGRHHRKHGQCGDLGAEPHEEGALEAEARGQIAAAEVGDDAEEFVKQEQRRNLQGAVTELIEVEQYQHPDRPVRQRVRPVGERHDGVVADGGAHIEAATLRASSA